MRWQMSHMIARRRRWPLFTVERLGEDAGGGGFADASRSGEEVGMGDPATFESVRECRDDRLLADQIGKRLRTIAACQHGVGDGSAAPRPLLILINGKCVYGNPTSGESGNVRRFCHPARRVS